MAGDVARGGVDRPEVDLPLGVDHDRHDDDDRLGLAEAGRILPGRGAQATGGDQLGDAVDERLLVEVRRLAAR